MIKWMLGVWEKLTDYNKHLPYTLLLFRQNLNILYDKNSIFGNIRYYWMADKASGLMVCPHNSSASH